MSKGKFVLAQVTNLDDMKVGEILPESDYSHLARNGRFLQFKYEESKDENDEPVIVKPGIWTIAQEGQDLCLKHAEFAKDAILEDFVYTAQVEGLVDKFFSRLDVYKKYGIEVPKRGGFLYGPPGSGKTTILIKISEKYNKDGKTAVIIYPTNKYKPYDVKDFVKTFKYEGGVEKLIFVMEDLGGIEIDKAEMPSDPSLLGLLDNTEKVFSIPVYILSTTNHPHIFLANLANRPGRFDDKIKVPHPKPEARLALLKFFLKEELNLLTEEVEKVILSSKTEEFTPAHIKEAIIRSALHDKTLSASMIEISAEIDVFKNEFNDKKGTKFGFRGNEDD